MFGGYSVWPPPTTSRYATSRLSGLTMSSDGKPHGYAVYSSHAAAPGPNNILFEDFTSIDTGADLGAISTGTTITSTTSTAQRATTTPNVVVRRAHLTGPTAQVAGGTNTAAFYIWASTLNTS